MTEIPSSAESAISTIRAAADATVTHAYRRHHALQSTPLPTRPANRSHAARGDADTRRWRYGSAVEAARGLASGGAR